MKETKEIKVTYNGIEVTYNEQKNQWIFELRGRERKAESLQKAKEAIDAPPPKEKKPFTRFFAWWNQGYYGMREWFKVEVTSIADSERFGRPEVYIVIPKESERSLGLGRARCKVNADTLYPCGEANDKIISEIEAFRKQADELRDKCETLKRKLKPYIVPEEKSDESTTNKS